MIHSNSNKAQWRGDISLVHSPGKQPGRKGIFCKSKRLWGWGWGGGGGDNNLKIGFEHPHI